MNEATLVGMDKPGAETTGRWKQGIWILAILAACALLRFYILLVDSMPMLYGDSGTYLYMARVLAPNWDRPIGYSLFLAVVFAVTDKLQAVSAAQAVLGLATAYVWYRLALERIGRIGAVAVALLVGLNLQAVVMEHYLLSEAFSVFLVSVFFYLLWRWFQEPHWILSALVAVAAVALGLTRTVFLIVLLLPAAVWVLTWWQGKAAIGRIVREAVLFTGIVGFLLGGYALWVGSYFGSARVTLFDGWALYQLVGKWTDCSGEKNRATDALCRANPADNSRQQWKNIIWDHSGPAHLLLMENNGSHAKTNDDLRQVALEIIRADPARYLKKVATNLVQMVTGGDFYWTRVTSESTASQNGVQNELQRRWHGRQDMIGYRVDDRFDKVSVLLYVKYVVVVLFFLAAALHMATRKDPFSLLSAVFVMSYAVACSATVEGDWSRFFVPIHNVMAMVGVAGVVGWVGPRAGDLLVDARAGEVDGEERQRRRAPDVVVGSRMRGPRKHMTARIGTSQRVNR